MCIPLVTFRSGRHQRSVLTFFHAYCSAQQCWYCSHHVSNNRSYIEQRVYPRLSKSSELFLFDDILDCVARTQHFPSLHITSRCTHRESAVKATSRPFRRFRAHASSSASVSPRRTALRILLDTSSKAGTVIPMHRTARTRRWREMCTTR